MIFRIKDFNLSEFFNWGIFWRIATIATGIIMLFFIPKFIDNKGLALFYALYSSFGAVSLVDFGLSNKIFVSGIKFSENILKNDLVSSLIFRFLILFAGFICYSFFLKDFAIFFLSPILSGVIYSSIAALVLITLLCQSYFEGNIDEKLVYMSKTLGELTGAFFLIVSLFYNIGFESILIYFLSKSIFSLIILFYNPKNRIITQSSNIAVEKLFTWKLGAVMVVGYLSGLGLLNIVFQLFETSASAMFSQLYLVGSTLFSFCMAIALYKQKEIKSFDINIDTKNYKNLKGVIQNQIEKNYIFLSILLIILIGALKLLKIDVIKFHLPHLFLILLFFYFLINNHIVAIFSRVKGQEILFPISIGGGILVVIVTFILSYSFGQLYALLVGISLLSYLVNFKLTNYFFNRFLESVVKEN